MRGTRRFAMTRRSSMQVMTAIGSPSWRPLCPSKDSAVLVTAGERRVTYCRILSPDSALSSRASDAILSCSTGTRTVRSVIPSPDPKRRTRRSSARAGWRTWVACYALLALTWPSLGPLPWIVALVAPSDTHEAEDGHERAEPHAHHHHGDASDIPGSPTHPADHDCTPCQMFKHLARCVLPPPVNPPTIALPAACPVLPQVVAQAPATAQVVSLPPARGPPSRIA